MDTQDVGLECPICGKAKTLKRLLYGHAVCKRCYYAFANRRQAAFAIDAIVWYCCLLLIVNIGLIGSIGPYLSNCIPHFPLQGWIPGLFYRQGNDGRSGY